MKAIITLFPILFISLLVNSCNDSVNGIPINGFASEQLRNAIHGTVLDKYSKPVAGAEIHYYFGGPYLAKNGLSKTYASLNKQESYTTISWLVPTESQTLVRISRLGTRELMLVVVDTVLRAGSYNHLINTSDWTNGCYIVESIIGKSAQAWLLVLSDPDNSTLPNKRPLTATNWKGEFTLPYSTLGIGETYSVINENNQAIGTYQIPDSFSVVIVDNKKVALVEDVKINMNEDFVHSFILK